MTKEYKTNTINTGIKYNETLSFIGYMCKNEAIPINKSDVLSNWSIGLFRLYAI